MNAMPATKTTKSTTKTKKQSANSLSNIQGKQRVIIANVDPQVQNGQFPIKRSVGEAVQVEADIFADSHDKIRSFVQFRKEGENNWQEVPMNPVMNDRWTATFIPESIGFYEFTVSGYIDHYASWQYGLRKKHEASQDISVEMRIGADMLDDIAKRAKGKDQQQISDVANRLRNTSDADEAVAMALSDDITEYSR